MGGRKTAEIINYINAESVNQKIKKVHIRPAQIREDALQVLDLSVRMLSEIDQGRSFYVDRLFAGKSNRTCWLFHKGNFQHMGTTEALS